MSDSKGEPQDASIDQAIGHALRSLREGQGLTAKQLAKNADVSAAMISRIESGQVSPSISTLNALSQALAVPLVSLFRETASAHVDITHVKKGKGLTSTRMVNNHSHEFVNLAKHTRRDIHFEASVVTLERHSGKPPTYIGHGVLFLYALEGEAIYTYGDRNITFKAGDSLSFDAEMRHGFTEVISQSFKFITVQAERRG